jgi:hypothetical protein
LVCALLVWCAKIEVLDGEVDLLPASTEQYRRKAQAAISGATTEEKRLAQPPLHEIAGMDCV